MFFQVGVIDGGNLPDVEVVVGQPVGKEEPSRHAAKKAVLEVAFPTNNPKHTQHKIGRAHV